MSIAGEHKLNVVGNAEELVNLLRAVEITPALLIVRVALGVFEIGASAD